MLHLHRDPRANLSKEKGTRSKIEHQQEKEDISPTGGRKRKREGGKEGRKEDGRKKETKAMLQNAACTFPCTHVTFKELRFPSNLQMLVSKYGKDRAVYRC